MNLLRQLEVLKRYWRKRKNAWFLRRAREELRKDQEAMRKFDRKLKSKLRLGEPDPRTRSLSSDYMRSLK